MAKKSNSPSGYEESDNTLLGNYRVLDLTDDNEYSCGKLMAFLGAEVIKIEAPGGDPGRDIGPFFEGNPDREKSISWWASNVNKKSATLDIQTREGQKTFLELAQTADFVIESFAPGYLDELGLGYSELSKINPAIVVTSITPFGQTGPYAHYHASDLVLMAMGGPMSQTGEPDGLPLRWYQGQSYQIAGAYAASNSLIAHHYRVLSGRGQHIDVSIQECVTTMPLVWAGEWELARHVTPRSDNRPWRAGMPGPSIRHLWLCRDGFVTFVLHGGRLREKENQALAEWISEDGISDRLRHVDWETFEISPSTQAEMLIWEPLIERLFLRYTRNELEEGGVRRGIQLVAVRSVKEVVEGEHFAERRFWAKIDHPELSTSFKYPGRLFSCTHTENGVRFRAPLIGEHNLEVYCAELGISTEELSRLRKLKVI